MCPSLSPFLLCLFLCGLVFLKDILNCECPPHVLEWIPGSYNQQILSKRISLSPTVWPWCICSVIRWQLVDWKSCPRRRIPGSCESGVETCLKNRKITDNLREQEALGQYSAGPHRVSHTDCCGHCCGPLVLYHAGYSIFWISYQCKKS